MSKPQTTIYVGTLRSIARHESGNGGSYTVRAIRELTTAGLVTQQNGKLVVTAAGRDLLNRHLAILERERQARLGVSPHADVVA